MLLLPLVEETFSSEIKLCYQKDESLYKQLVTVKSGVIGNTAYFNKSSAGSEAGKKATFGKIPRNGGALSRVSASLETFYAADEIDEQDISETSANGMLAITDNAMASMEQKVDTLILTAMADSTNTVDPSKASGLTLDKAKEIWGNFQNGHVFKRKEVPVVSVGTQQWDDLLGISQFTNADSVGYEQLPYLFTKAQTGRFWLDMIWRIDPDLDVASNVRTCYAFVPSSVGLALSGINKTRVVETDEDTVLYYARQKLGAVLIDEVGCQKVYCKES